MGQDKALLPHPEGGTWLSRTADLLAGLQAPITLCSHHSLHRRQLEALIPPIATTQEPAPGQGPLNALHHLMELHPHEHLLLCAVDMPWLDAASLNALTMGRQKNGNTVLVAADGERLHPLLGIYPVTPRRRNSLGKYLATGRRSLLGWLHGEAFSTVSLSSAALRNCNSPEDWTWAAG
jgi:molybdopterin-guanine dinucleotide biosynthesis protein A